MKVIKISALFLLIIVLLSGCVTVQERESSPARDCLEAQTAYIHAWETYHRFWEALPESDPRKQEWVEKYHKDFLEAGQLLQRWCADPESFEKQMDFEIMFTILEHWLLEKMREG